FAAVLLPLAASALAPATPQVRYVASWQASLPLLRELQTELEARSVWPRLPPSGAGTIAWRVLLPDGSPATDVTVRYGSGGISSIYATHSPDGRGHTTTAEKLCWLDLLHPDYPPLQVTGIRV